MKHSIRIVFEQLSLQKFAVSSIIRRCIHSALDAEGICVPCEINVQFIDHFRPKMFVFENVTGIQTARGGEPFRDLQRRVSVI